MSDDLTSKEPVLADYIARWSNVNVVAHEQERSAREDHATALIAWLRSKVERLQNHLRQKSEQITQLQDEPSEGPVIQHVYTRAGRAAVTGIPGPDHDCDAMACSSLEHIIARVPHTADEAPVPPSAWLPIETAPKDGEQVIAMLKLREVLSHLVSGASLRTDGGDGYDPPEYWVERRYGAVGSELIQKMLRDGWIESHNGGYRLTDAGHRAYMCSTDELGDGELRAPAETSERARRLDAAAATGIVEHYTALVQSMIDEDTSVSERQDIHR